MSNGKKILKNIFSLTVAELAGKGLQAFVILYIAKLLGDVEYGTSGYGCIRNAPDIRR
jgi:O-antigen/teichoic acid export membrane protein